LKEQPHVRIARPVSSLARTQAMYCQGLGLQVVGSFENHDGFDGVMLGAPGGAYHFEFTVCRMHPVTPAPTTEDLVVFYLPDNAEWLSACDSMIAAGFELVASFNPYWDRDGRTFRDHDGYCIVLQRGAWHNTAA